MANLVFTMVVAQSVKQSSRTVVPLLLWLVLWETFVMSAETAVLVVTAVEHVVHSYFSTVSVTELSEDAGS